MLPAQSAGLTTAMTVLGFLLSFLLVFKTQTAYGQFWTALGEVEGLLKTSRSIALATCTMLDWSHTDSKVLESVVKVRARQIIRFTVLHFFVVIEYFQRTGSNQTKDPEVMDRLREDIKGLTGDDEYRVLYPN